MTTIFFMGYYNFVDIIIVIVYNIDSRLVTKDTFIDGTGCDYNVYYRYLYTKDNELLCYKGDKGKKPKVIKL